MAKNTKPKKQPASRKAATSKAKRPSLIRRVLPSLLTVGFSFVIVIGIGLLPARTWLAQRESIADTQSHLDALQTEVAKLEVQLQLLETDSEVERVARQNFDYVYPGEESYRILPAPAASGTD
jgi:cell division protein FtsB